MRRLAALFALLLALVSSTAWAQLPARPEGPIADHADILPAAEEQKLDQELRSYFSRTGNALVVTSVVSLNDRPIEEVSLATARAWGIGDTRGMRGLMIMVAPNERRVRIEVACGLESVITNERAQEIIDRTMLPLFKAGKNDKATLAGARALMQATSDFLSDLGKAPHSAGCFEEAA